MNTDHLPVFEPDNEAEFNVFVEQLRRHCLDPLLFVHIYNKITSFIGEMHRLGLDDKLDVEFQTGNGTGADGSVCPVCLMWMTAHGEPKTVYVLGMTPDNKGVITFDEMTPELAKSLSKPDQMSMN